MNNKIKYVILDFGKVLFYPVTGNWFITPSFYDDLANYNIDESVFLSNINKYSYVLNKKIITLDEEYNMFYEFYKNILSDFNVADNIVSKIAYDFVYSDDKYNLYNEVIDELKVLKEKYTLILLSDNWPCMYRILKHNNIDKYFDKMYSSSDYGVKKEDGLLFDYPIKEFNIKAGEVIFIDDNESLLDIAVTKGLIVRHMDRENKIINSKYRVISELKNIM
jgi:putative hydrolase of the HAD superfamily